MLDPRASVVEWIRTNAVANTKTTYVTYQKQYKEYTQAEGLDPSKGEALCSFMRHGLEERALSRSTLTKVIPSAVADLFRFENLSPTDDRALLRGTKDVIARKTKPSVPRKPISRAQLLEMARVCKNDPTQVRDVFILLLMFLGFLRESEVVALQTDDVWIGRAPGQPLEVVYMVIRKSKTDQTGENATILLSACPGSDLCPVKWLRHHRRLQPSQGKHLFCAVKGANALSRRTPHQLVRKWLQRIGVNPTGYGSHSMRRGGATAAVRAKVQMHVVKRHGRWASDAVYLYVVDSDEGKLSLTQAILGSE